MSAVGGERFEQRLIVLALTAKDAELTCSILGRAGVECAPCLDLAQACAELEAGGGAMLVAEEVVAGQQKHCLDEWLAGQPHWSDLPILILARPGADSAIVAQSMELLGNVTVLERPIRVAALVSAVRSALRARQRQYQLRDQVLALQAKEAELQLVTGSTPLILARLGRDLRYRFVNPATAGLHGLTPAEMVGRSIVDQLGDDGYETFRPYVERVLSGERVEFETLVQYPAVGPRWLHTTYQPERDAAGEVDGWLASVSDITDRKRAEENLQRSEERYRSLVSVITDVLWVTDPQGAFVTPQAEWESYTGQGWEQHRGFGWVQALHPDERDGAWGAWVAARATGSLYETRGRLWHARSREHRYIIARATPILELDGTVREWIGTFTDVHEGHLAEQALRDGDRRKDEFLAILAHELRNPLAPIRNSLHILRLTGQNDPASDGVAEMMERQVNHMVRLVDDLMEVSRITRSQIELRKERVEVAAVVRSAVETSRPLIDAAGHSLILSTPPGPLLLEGDPVRLTQVIANLLNNAAKYTPEAGEIWLTVRRNQGEVVISVKDSGTGIPADMLPRVFDLFTQVDRDAGRAQGGLGIGLTLVKSLVEMHGGSVQAFSAGEDRGSEFILRLPLAAPSALPPAGGEEERPAEDLAARRILVVDDNRDAAQSLGKLLGLLGAQVDVAYSGQEALEALAARKPAVVLLDIGMPGMNGYEVARRIRERPELKGVMLVALTGWGQDEDRHRSQEAGFDHHLVKPADVEALRALLASLDGVRAER